MFAINIAHELMHRRSADRYVAGILLSMASNVQDDTCKSIILTSYAAGPRYGTTRPDHLLLLAPVVCRQLRKGGSPERPAGQTGTIDGRSEIVVWSAFTAAWLPCRLCWAARRAVLALQGVTALQFRPHQLPAHYGLMRRAGLDGRIEPVQDHHSWTQGMFLDDLILLNLPRHSNHHSHPQRPFQLLKDSAEAPRYPYSYAVMTLLLLLPPAFRRIVHPRLDRFQANRASITA